MGKRVRSVSTYSQQQPKGCNSEDRISQLPEEILVFILSFLTLREATVTSVLARRWRYLWASFSNLDFDATETLDKIAMQPELLNMERPKYVKWVNRVVGLHSGPTLNKFRVYFDLDESSKRTITIWIKFALAKKVQKLELDLSKDGEAIRNPSQSYTFPISLLGKSRGPSLKHLRPNSFVAFNSLKALCLKCVNVSGEVLEYFLSHCPVLERLSVHGSGDLVSLKVAGPSLVLKYLEIYCCFDIETIEIYDTNLISFIYSGGKIGLLLKNVPLLTEVSIGGGFSTILNYVFGQLSCCLSQLEILTLCIRHVEDFMKLPEIPEFPKLKHLVLQVYGWEDESLLGFTPLIKASPYLQRFVLQLTWMPGMRRTRRKVRKALECPHQYLKVVELAGYYGRTTDLELAMYFIQNAVALEKIIIDPSDQFVSRLPKEIYKIKKEQAARSYAKQQLERKEPPGVELVIL